MILIGISGKKGSGKDLLANYFVTNYGFVNFSFASSLKEAVRRDFFLTNAHTDGILKEEPLTQYVQEWEIDSNPDNRAHQPKKFYTPREIMIAYGQFFRQFDPNFWVKQTFNKINVVLDYEDLININVKLTISDVRFKNEANYIKEQGGLLVRLERKPELNIYKTPSMDVSETDLDNYEGFDFKLSADENIDPFDLEQFADRIMQSLAVK